MYVNLNNCEQVEVADRDEAVEVIKREMKAWMNDDDRLVWEFTPDAKNRGDAKPDLARVTNESYAEPADDFAMICPGRLSRDKKCPCGGNAPLASGCGAYVCEECDNHIGLARCFCGWAADGGDGYRQLEEMGEVIEPENY